MAVCPDTQEHKIEGRLLAAEQPLQLLLVGQGSRLRGDFSQHAVDVGLGKRHPLQQGLASHAEVALLVGRGHAPLIAEKNVRFLPLNAACPFRHGEVFVNRLRGAATRQSNRKPPPLVNRLAGTRNHEISRFFGKIGSIFDDMKNGRCVHAAYSSRESSTRTLPNGPIAGRCGWPRRTSSSFPRSACFMGRSSHTSGHTSNWVHWSRLGAILHLERQDVLMIFALALGVGLLSIVTPAAIEAARQCGRLRRAALASDCARAC